MVSRLFHLGGLHVEAKLGGSPRIAGVDQRNPARELPVASECGSQHYWQANGGVTYQDPDGREVVFASWIYRPPPSSP